MYRIIVKSEHTNIPSGDRLRKMTAESDFMVPDANLIEELVAEVQLIRAHADGKITSIEVTWKAGSF